MPTKANVNPKSIQENQLAFKIRKSSRIISYAAESEIETTYEIAKCQVVSLSNIVLAGLQTIDGVALAASDLVCVNGQTDATENGIYEVAATAWLRAYDINELYGAGVVGGGWENGTLWALESSNYEVGVDDITFVKIGTLEHSRLIDDEPERHIPTPVRRGMMALSDAITDGMEWVEHLSFIAGSPHGWFQISEADARYDVGAEALVSIADEAAGSVLDTLVEIRRRSAAGIMRLIGLPDSLTPDKVLIVDADGNVGTDDLPSGGGLPAGSANETLYYDGTDWVPNDMLMYISSIAATMIYSNNVHASYLQVREGLYNPMVRIVRNANAVGNTYVFEVVDARSINTAIKFSANALNTAFLVQNNGAGKIAAFKNSAGNTITFWNDAGISSSFLENPDEYFLKSDASGKIVLSTKKESDIGSGSMPAGSDNAILRHNGTAWIVATNYEHHADGAVINRATKVMEGENRTGVSPNSLNLLYDNTKILLRNRGTFPIGTPVPVPRRVDEPSLIALPHEGVYDIVIRAMAATEGVAPYPPNNTNVEVFELTVAKSESVLEIVLHAAPHTAVRVGGLSTPHMFSVAPSGLLGIELMFTANSAAIYNLGATVEINEMNNNF